MKSQVLFMPLSIMLYSVVYQKGTQGIMEGSSIMIGNDSDIVEQLMQPHSSFVITMQSRFMKLQVCACSSYCTFKIALEMQTFPKRSICVL